MDPSAWQRDGAIIFYFMENSIPRFNSVLGYRGQIHLHIQQRFISQYHISFELAPPLGITK